MKTTLGQFFDNNIQTELNNLTTLLDGNTSIKCEICDGEGTIPSENEFGVETSELCSCTLDKLDRMTPVQRDIFLDDSVNYEQD